jgi:hypothetical protein
MTHAFTAATVIAVGTVIVGLTFRPLPSAG